jgi:hypothetical protein
MTTFMTQDEPTFATKSQGGSTENRWLPGTNRPNAFRQQISTSNVSKLVSEINVPINVVFDTPQRGLSTQLTPEAYFEAANVVACN